MERFVEKFGGTAAFFIGVPALMIVAFVGVADADEATSERSDICPEYGTLSVVLQDAFSYELNGVKRRGFQKDSALESVCSEIAAEATSASPDDCFPRDPVVCEKISAIDRSSGLKVTCERWSYDAFPVTESLVWFENVSDKNSPNLRNVFVFDDFLQTGKDARLTFGYGEDSDPKKNYSMETAVLQPGDSMTFTPREAYSSFGAFPYFVVEGSERSFIVAVGWSGRWTATFEATENGSVRLTTGQKDVDLYLKPGEKIRTPRITIFEYPPGTDYINLWRDWYRRYVMPRENNVVLRPKFALDVFYKGELYDKVTAEEQIDAIRRLRALGYPCEALWIDAGWYLRANPPQTCVGYWFGVGDWTPDPARFPSGLRPVVDELENVPDGERKGELVLWFEPERVHKTQLNDELKQYVVPDLELIESYRMNMASDKTVDYLSERIGNALVENGVTIYRQDSNGVGPLAFIESLEANDPEYNDRKGYAENRYVRGLYRFWENLKKRVPNLIFDSCASGGRRNDLEMLRLGAVPLHYSDVGYFDFVEKQHMHDTLNRWFIYYKNIDPHDYDFEKGEYDVYKTTIDAAPFSTVRPYFFENPTPGKRNYADRYFAIRELLVDGDYYPLRVGMTERDWSVWQFDDSRSTDQSGARVSYAKDSVRRYVNGSSTERCDRQVGCVLCVRNEKSDEDSVVVHPRQIDLNATYRWENLDSGESTTIEGKKMATEGISVAIPPRSGVVFKYSVVD